MTYSEEDQELAAMVLSICACQGPGWYLNIQQVGDRLGFSQRVQDLATVAWDNACACYMPDAHRIDWRELYAEAEARIRNGEEP